MNHLTLPNDIETIPRLNEFIDGFCEEQGISMEIYLLHINKDYSSVVTDFLHSALPLSLVSVVWFIIVVAISWLLHLAVKKLTALPSRPR